MMELTINKKYLLHKGTPQQEVVTYDKQYNGRKVFVVNKQRITKIVDAMDLSEMPKNKLSEIGKWVGGTLLTILVKETFASIRNAFKK